jgi:hypothetical protein
MIASVNSHLSWAGRDKQFIVSSKNCNEIRKSIESVPISLSTMEKLTFNVHSARGGRVDNDDDDTGRNLRHIVLS